MPHRAETHRAPALRIATFDGLGERFVPVAPDAIRGSAQALLERRDGSIWAGITGARLVRIEGEAVTQVALESGLAGEAVMALHEDAAGTLWIGTSAGIWRYRDEPVRVLPFPALGFRSSPRTGELWILTSAEVLRVGAQGPLPVWRARSRSTGRCA